MKLSVIIACHNAEATIGETLEALAGQYWDQPWEVLVVNNRSTDRSLDVVERFRGRVPGLRIITALDRQAQAYALNVGVAASSGESIVICDADDVVGTGWLPAIGAALERHAFVAARTEETRLNSGWVLQSRGNNQSRGLQAYRYPPYLSHAGGCSLAIHRTLLNALGGFDERMIHLFDTDLCWRAQLAGFELHFAPEAVVHMRYRNTLRRIFRQSRRYSIYNVRLYKCYRSRGMPPITLRMSIRAWWDLLPRLAQVRNKGSFAAWLWYFAQRIGRLQGSLKYRVMAL